MTNTAPLLRCAHCGISSLYDLENIERDRGDLIVRCPACDVRNVLAPLIETQMIHITGWRED